MQTVLDMMYRAYTTQDNVLRTLSAFPAEAQQLHFLEMVPSLTSPEELLRVLNAGLCGQDTCLGPCCVQPVLCLLE